MRENHTSGSVQGVPGNRHSYCDIVPQYPGAPGSVWCSVVAGVLAVLRSSNAALYSRKSPIYTALQRHDFR